ncbi:MAG TPA: hypothetical protein VHZ54_02245 [Solirubrobacterales bacterium]|nr:hypothetical protein [Solirubrobacterales bacterium]
MTAAASDSARPTLPVLRADERFVEALADVVADRVVERLGRDRRDEEEGFLDADGAALRLSTSRQRIHELTSNGVLRPDGRDGRRPLFRRSSLDRYVEEGMEAP